VPAGLQVFNSSGGLILDVTDSLTMILGSRYFSSVASGTSGSFTVSVPTGCKLFAYCAPDRGLNYINITISGSTITYYACQPPLSNQAASYNFTVIYGVY
jgi:hypothetical protein